MKNFYVVLHFNDEDGNHLNYTTEIPYIPRKGDFLNIYGDDDEFVVYGQVEKIIYHGNYDTRGNMAEAPWDIKINSKGTFSAEPE